VRDGMILSLIGGHFLIFGLSMFVDHFNASIAPKLHVEYLKTGVVPFWLDPFLKVGLLLLVGAIVIWNWRGWWYVPDLYLYCEDPEKSALISLLIGLLMQFPIGGVTYSTDAPLVVVLDGEVSPLMSIYYGIVGFPQQEEPKQRSNSDSPLPPPHISEFEEQTIDDVSSAFGIHRRRSCLFVCLFYFFCNHCSCFTKIVHSWGG